MVTLYPFEYPHHHHTAFLFEVRHTLWNMALKMYSPCSGEVSVPYESRIPDSPFVEMIWHGRANNDTQPLCSADVHWYLRFLRRKGKVRLLACGPTTNATMVAYQEEDEFLGIRFRPGVFLTHLPPNAFVNTVVDLSEGASNTLWLHGSAWEVPTYDTADMFLDQLFRADLVACDPVVAATRQGQVQERTARSVQMHFLQATGLSQKLFQQIERARYAGALLQQRLPVLDVVFQAGYYDQAHLTRSLYRFLGHPPSHIMQMG